MYVLGIEFPELQETDYMNIRTYMHTYTQLGVFK